ncbi:ATP-binding protein [Bacteroides thetaiotaomicron]|uniref:sensor histidine kinase n=1 Tax=Bacteroides thetaiotaomicron TaxID=818 RepID=UPI0018985AFD|nr:ATP-binding protein [Bacteroides thetaiotaomicron]MCB7008039.1 HAMP domain-containing protein [Bacteroides thetaiotaomicron]MCB7364469.1 HAMP domain-containing protein [Bacteroides thetaiotaomicron]MCQ5018712.1 ATP-binding protein [Bacteroides thetaiotaomicron]MCQ5106682.1 ATP-binding protein [Bacteroides thetaiotaomicron]MDC2279208.1 ATP-binding protein [Bacteroides thetaiotaomicron]
MRIKGFFGILVFLLLVLGGGLLFLSSRLNMIYFYIGEGLVLFILCYLPFFYRKIVKPLNSIGSGMELLREQDFSSRLSPVGQYEADRIVNVFNRMMEQLKNERLRLREQNNFLDLLIKASPMGVILTTLDEDLSELNPMAQKMLGVRQEDVLGKKMNEIDSPLAAELANVPKGETATVRLNDSNIYRCTHSSFIDRGFQHPFFLIESLTDEVMKAEKKAYEKVIRMIAHEVNNTTAGITSTLDTVEQALSTEEGMDDICDVMRVCTERCFSMSRFITRFADVVKIPEPTLTPVDLNDLAFTCKRFMEGMCADRNIKLRLEIDETLKEVKMDASLFEQVLVNIIKNAAESIEKDGEIIVRTLSPATIEVVDNGKGISKEVEAKLFSPFFSTKPNGQGIGLIFIREVLMRHGCTFSLRTYADGLTRFRILFP